MTRDELDNWEKGVDLLRKEISALPEEARTELERLCRLLVSCREQLFALSPPGAGAVCASCGGECCRTGKFHVRVADILAIIISGKVPASPPAMPGMCPFLTRSGCMMSPSERPFPCIIFNCDRIETGMDTQDLELFHRLEDDLRGVYRRLSEATSGSSSRIFLDAVSDAVRDGRALLAP